MHRNPHYGAYYFSAGDSGINRSRPVDLYAYTCYHGAHKFKVDEGDSLVMVSGRNGGASASWHRGKGEQVQSNQFAVILRGYACGDKVASLDQATNLPYVNGCSTRQIFPPERIGDPTVQQLTIPPFTSEQVHHIHPTARVVYVLSGNGYSIVGQSDCVEEVELKQGMTVILDPMVPHHFRTEDEHLTVIPVHIFSSTPAAIESSHPMFNGTVRV